MSTVHNPLMQQLALTSPLWLAPLPFDLASASVAGRISAAGAMGIITVAAHHTLADLEAALKAYRSEDKRPAFCFTHALPESTPTRINPDAARHIYQQLDLPDQATADGASFDALLKAAIAAKPRAIGFARGIPERANIERIRKQNIYVFAICHSMSEALVAQDFAVDSIVFQGVEAGGIHYRFNNQLDEPAQPALTLLSQARAHIHLPIVLWGDFPAPQDVVAALIAGAQGVMLDRPWLACGDAGLSEAQQKRLTNTPETESQLSTHFSTLPMRHLPSPLYHKLHTDYREREHVFAQVFSAKPQWRVLCVSASSVPPYPSVSKLVETYVQGIAQYIA